MRRPIKKTSAGSRKTFNVAIGAIMNTDGCAFPALTMRSLYLPAVIYRNIKKLHPPPRQGGRREIIVAPVTCSFLFGEPAAAVLLYTGAFEVYYCLLFHRYFYTLELWTKISHGPFLRQRNPLVHVHTCIDALC